MFNKQNSIFYDEFTPPIKKELTPYTKRELSRRVYKINFNEFLAEYSRWLDCSELKSVNNYLSYARTLEKDVFLKWYADEDYDYLLNLVLAQRNSDMEAYKDVKQWGDDYLTNYMERTKAEDDLNTRRSTSISDLRSGWRKLCEFVEQEISADNARLQSKSIIGMEGCFLWWLMEEEGFTIDSARTYDSRLDNIAKNLFEKEGFHNIIKEVQAIAVNNADDALTIADNLVSHVEEEKENGCPITGWTENVAGSSKSTIRKFRDYIVFLAQAMHDDEPWGNEKDEMVREIPVSCEMLERIREETGRNLHIFDKEALYRRFSLRLFTQDRYTDNGRLIFPIRSIKKALTHCWLPEILETYPRRWGKKSLDKMKVWTNKGVRVMAEVEELRIKDDGTVFVTLINGEKEQLFTHDKAQELVPLEAKNKDLRDISIEHLTPITSYLKDNLDKLPALKTVVEKGEVNAHDEELLIDLIFDLDFLARTLELELMQSDYNVNPGKNANA